MLLTEHSDIVLIEFRDTNGNLIYSTRDNSENGSPHLS